MIGRCAGAIVVMCGVVAPIAVHAASVEKFRNEKVVVTEVTLAPGEPEATPEKLPSQVVYITDGTVLNGTVRNETEPRQVGKGQVVGFVGAIPAIRNMGKTPLHFVRVEFLTGGEDETWGMNGLPSSYKIVSEDRYARTYEIRLPAGAVEGQHTHHARVVVCLSGTEMEHILPDGTKQLVTLKTGDILWREAATHAGHNLGKTELWEIAVEPK